LLTLTILATLRLQEKHVPCTLLCPLCNQEEEDEWHTFFGCEASKQEWQSAGLEAVIMPRLQQNLGAKNVLFSVCTGEDHMTAGLVATVAWVLWNNRNNKVWNDVAEPGRILGFKAKQIYEEWKAVQHLQNQDQQGVQQHHQHTWQVPPHGWLKCNVVMLMRAFIGS
jgi:hypothetical protein